jgi:hypothetical protein
MHRMLLFKFKNMFDVHVFKSKKSVFKTFLCEDFVYIYIWQRSNNREEINKYI